MATTCRTAVAPGRQRRRRQRQQRLQTPASPRHLRRSCALLAAGVLVLLTLLARPAESSEGDRMSIFQNCLKKCTYAKCTDDEPYLSRGEPLPLTLRLTRWTCRDDCSYGCQQTITRAAVQHGERVLQYYGKWPFVRYLGMQEPFSVLFSVINGWAHWRELRTLRKAVPRDYYHRKWLVWYVLVSCNLWLWSAVFHTRDWGWTEKLDYFSAFGSILYSLICSVVRIFRVTSPGKQAMLLLSGGCFFFYHVGYLALVHFDYGRNVLVCLMLAAAHHFLWCGWSARAYSAGRPYWRMPLLSVLALTCAMSLEILDFPPLWGAVDAHALWHAASIPVIPYWYRFLIRDARWESRLLRPHLDVKTKRRHS